MLIASCKSSEQSTTAIINKQESIEEKFLLAIQFASDEDLKRVPYHFQNLRMELIKPISEHDRIYQTSILCKAYEIDGIVEKFNLHQGIDWAKRAE